MRSIRGASHKYARSLHRYEYGSLIAEREMRQHRKPNAGEDGGTIEVPVWECDKRVRPGALSRSEGPRRCCVRLNARPRAVRCSNDDRRLPPRKRRAAQDALLPLITKETPTVRDGREECNTMATRHCHPMNRNRRRRCGSGTKRGGGEAQRCIWDHVPQRRGKATPYKGRWCVRKRAKH